MKNLQNFQKVNYVDIARKLVQLGGIKFVSQNYEKFKIAPSDFYDVCKEAYPDFIAEMEDKLPRLSAQAKKSPELLLELISKKSNFSALEKSIKQNPFLISAVEENPRFGCKLMLKFFQFDKSSQDNVKALFEKKEEILNRDSQLDVQSVEFRKLMQEELSNYKNNPNILAVIAERGVNVDSWLNYEKSVNFALGGEEDVKFSDKIQTPIVRIRETLGKYQGTIIDVLTEYKDDLRGALIPNPEADALREKVQKQKENIEKEVNPAKAEGMQKGLESLEAKMQSLKPISLWDRVQSDIFRLKSLIDNVFKYHDLCLASETKLETIKDRKELIKEKDKFEQYKRQLRDGFKEFEIFFDSFGEKFASLAEPSLGRGRVESLMQDINERMSESFSHYGTDKDALAEIFKNDNNENDGLKGHEMKISVASRYPSSDLYLGNYCPCCICIESDFHRSESPISDYVSDLGMQNIVVYDEKKNIPVIACWTFIGEKAAGGEPVLVIDNIEANTSYTNAYPEQFKSLIKEYIEDYAKAANINEIIQGPSNNDLIVFPLGTVTQKLGAIYNRSSGYFLEAEGDDEDEEFDDEEYYYNDEDDGNNY